MSVLTILAAVVMFGLLIAVHEFGHFAVAKLNGVTVLEYSIGFGPPVFQFQRGDTLYGLRAIPLGGYVRMAGMDDGQEGPGSFNSKSVWRRFTIIVAGATVNLVLPLFLLFAVLSGQEGAPVFLEAVQPGAPAAAAGLAAGDRVVAVNGSPVETVAGFRRTITGSGGKPLLVEFVTAQGRSDVRTVEPARSRGRWIIGVAPAGRSFDLVEGVVDAGKAWWGMVTGIIGGFGLLLTNGIKGGVAGPCGVSGPVGIVRETVSVAQAGLVPLIYFAGFLSLNLGILNLLPLPALDGGRLAFLIIEGIRRRPFDPLKEQRVHYAGFLALIGLIVLISYHDLVRIGTPFADIVRSCQQ